MQNGPVLRRLNLHLSSAYSSVEAAISHELEQIGVLGVAVVPVFARTAQTRAFPEGCAQNSQKMVTTNYATLQDACPVSPVFANPDLYVFFRKAAGRVKRYHSLTVNDLQSTHVCIGAVSALEDGTVDDAHLNSIFLQFKQWNPHGQADGLLEAKGVRRSQMDIGDVIYNPARQEFYVCKMLTWQAIPERFPEALAA